MAKDATGQPKARSPEVAFGRVLRRVRQKHSLSQDELAAKSGYGTAYLLSDDDPRERQRWLASQLPSSAGNARAVRLFGTQLLSVRIDLDE